MHSVLNLNIVRHWLTVHFMCFHRTLNASHSNARHWRMWATTAKRAAAKTNGFLICPCKKAEQVAMLDVMKGWTSHSLRMKANGLQPPLTAVMRRCCERESGALGTVRTGPVHSALPHQLVVSSEEQVVGTWTVKGCLTAQAVPENLHAGGVGVRWVGTRRVCVTIAACGTNIVKCRVNDPCMCRTLVTMNCSGIYAKLQVDCNRLC